MLRKFAAAMLATALIAGPALCCIASWQLPAPPPPPSPRLLPTT